MAIFPWRHESNSKLTYVLMCEVQHNYSEQRNNLPI